MARISIDYPGNTLFTHELSVRVTDLNFADHLAHDSIISLLHEARAQFFKANKMSELDVDGKGIIMADIAVNYRSEAYFGDMLIVEIALGDFSSKGCDFFYKVVNKKTGDVVAVAKTGIVFMDYETRKLAPVPALFLNIAGQS